MRTLFWSEVFWPHIGGAENFAAKLINGLRRHGHEFLVVAREDDPKIPRQGDFDGTPVYRFPFYATVAERNLDQLIRFRRQLTDLQRSFEPDLVHVNCFGLSMLFYMETAKAYQAPLLLTAHGDRYPPPVGSQTLLEQTLRMANWVTAPSEATIEYTRRLVPALNLRSSVIYNGVQPPTLSPTPLPMDPPRVLCLGRLAPEKGFNSALQAFASVVERFPAARLIFAGDGPERHALEKLSVQLNLTNSVSFRGWVSEEDVPALINTATLLLMPSHREGLPLVAIEAALMARPVIATRVGGLPEVVLHHETGILVEQADIGGLAEAILFLLTHPNIASQMGQNGRSRAESVFSLERCVDAYRSLYSNLAHRECYAGRKS